MKSCEKPNCCTKEVVLCLIYNLKVTDNKKCIQVTCDHLHKQILFFSTLKKHDWFFLVKEVKLLNIS